MIEKVVKEGDKPVVSRKGKDMTLREIFTEMGYEDITKLSIDSIDVQADHTLFNRFDRFNAKYNPLGNSDLRKIFLKTKNKIAGAYFAQLLRKSFTRLDEDGHLFTECRWVLQEGRFFDEG